MKKFIYVCMLCTSLGIIKVHAQNKDLFTDNRDGHVYLTVRINKLTWMAENLAYLPQIDRVEDGVFEEDRFWVYGYYGNSVADAKNTETYETYGVLYNWPAAMNACPEGWHLPDESQWQALEIFLGMDKEQARSRKWRESGEVGKKLKSSRGWHNNFGTDEVRFDALPGGCRGYNGFESKDYCGYFWVGSPTNGDNAWRRAILFDEAGIEKNEDRRYFGLSVRCVKDEL